MTTVIAQAEQKLELAAEDVVTFLKSDVWPFLVTFAKDLEADFIQLAIPIAQNAVAEIAAAPGNLIANPAVLSQIITTTATQLVSAGEQAAKMSASQSIATAAVAVQAALNKVQAATTAAAN